MLTYANDAKLYVPVSSLHLISRYAGGAEEKRPPAQAGRRCLGPGRDKSG